MLKKGVSQWASCQIRKIAGYACSGNAGNIFPTTTGQRSRHASRNVRGARAVMHDGVANWRWWGSRWWGKRSRHSRRMRNPWFYVSAKRPMMIELICFSLYSRWWNFTGLFIIQGPNFQLYSVNCLQHWCLCTLLKGYMEIGDIYTVKFLLKENCVMTNTRYSKLINIKMRLFFAAFGCLVS